MNILEIANKINDSGLTYYGEKAKGWSGGTVSRIYFGRDYVILENGIAHNNTAKARAKSIGESAVDIVKNIISK